MSRKPFGESGGNFDPRAGRRIGIEYDQQVPVAHQPSLLISKQSQSISQRQGDGVDVDQENNSRER